MKALRQVLLISILTVSALAVDNGHAKYVGGTVPSASRGDVYRVNTAPETALNFERAGTTLAIPYASIESFQYSREAARHLGVLPAMLVGLLKARQHRHYFRISYRSANGAMQVVMFEVPKRETTVLEAILDARAPHTNRTCHCVDGEQH